MADDYDQLLKLLMVEEKLRGHPQLAILKAKVDRELLAMAEKETPKPAPPPKTPSPIYPEGTTIQHPTTETASAGKERRP